MFHSLVSLLSSQVPKNWQVTGTGSAPSAEESRVQARENSQRRISEEEVLFSGNTSFTFFVSSLLSLAAATENQLQR